MVESQVRAEEYSRGRFGDMAPLDFSSLPIIERPAAYIRGKSRTDWYII
jgi:hypothetical protein